MFEGLSPKQTIDVETLSCKQTSKLELCDFKRRQNAISCSASFFGNLQTFRLW